MCVRGFSVVLIVFWIFGCLGQEEELTTTSAPIDEIETTTVYVPPIICTICECSGGLVDCSDRQVSKVFSPEECAGINNLEIQELDLSGNTIITVNEFPQMPIKVLNLSNSQIDTLGEEFMKNLPNLSTLDLSRNQIVSFSKLAFWIPRPQDSTIKGFSNMRKLILAHNELHTLPKDAFSYMPGLTYLDLSGNPLTFIDQVTMGEITELVFLTELRLSGCDLKTLPEGLLRRQRKLQILDLSNNKFTTVPTVLSEAVNLVYLNFDRNLLTALSEATAISKLRKLKELRLCRFAKLQSIGSGALGGLESLEVLHICNNPKLRTIDKNFLFWEDDEEVERWPSLKQLYLQNNNLTEINSAYLYRWDQLQNVDFSDNPFVCDCTNQWMVDVLVPLITSKTNGTADDMICTRPEDMRGVTFTQLAEAKKSLTCYISGEIKTEPGPNTAIILGIMIGIFAAFPLVLVLVLLWKKGYFTRCRKKLRSEVDSDDENDVL